MHPAQQSGPYKSLFHVDCQMTGIITQVRFIVTIGEFANDALADAGDRDPVLDLLIASDGDW